MQAIHKYQSQHQSHMGLRPHHILSILPLLGITSLTIVGAIYVNLFHHRAMAEQPETSAKYIFKTVTADTLRVTVPSNATPLPITPTSEGKFGSQDITISVETNSKHGYQLGMVTETTDLASGSKAIIPTLTSTLDQNNAPFTCTVETSTTCNFPVNYWGYKLATDAGYLPMTKGTLLASSDAPTNGDDISLSFGVKLDNMTPAGSYQIELNFIALANDVEIDFEDAFDMASKSLISYDALVRELGTESNPLYAGRSFYAMQDIGSVCSLVNAPTATAAYDWATPVVTPEAQLIDLRDAKVYWVAKLLDGKCWMTQNLDFDINATTAQYLTSEYTNLNKEGCGTGVYSTNYNCNGDVITWNPGTAGYTFTTNQIDNWKDTNNTLIQSFNPGNWYWQNGNYESSSTCNTGVYNGCNYLTNGETNYFKKTASSEYGEHGHVGNYYSWTAAVASSNTAPINTDLAKAGNSICPAGWRLPSMTANTEAGNEFYKLNALYNGGKTSGASGIDSGLVTAPVYLVRAGLTYSVGLGNAGHTGYYWSSASRGTAGTDANALSFYSTSLNPASNNVRYRGFSVRCVTQ